jgi:hypothetical protein
MSDGWVFGTTQLLALLGLLLTAGIAIFGFRSFGRWKHEQLELKRIDVALDALTLAYKCRHVFDNIRSPLFYEYEWSDMPHEAQPDNVRRLRGENHAVLKRIIANKEFFQEVWKTQPACMAVFGPKIEETFLEVHKARREIEVACEQLARVASESAEVRALNKEHWAQMRADRCGRRGGPRPLALQKRESAFGR